LLDRQPTLEGPALRLRPLREDDWAALYAVAADPLIWEQHPAHDRWRERVFRIFFDDALANRGALVVIDKENGAIIGSSRFQGLELGGGGSIEIGWTFLARDHWGGAANRELKRMMVGHALRSVAECRFAVGETNRRSIRALEKIGARLSPREDIREMAGKRERHLFFALDREGFSAGPLGRESEGA
jgi:RimJ/RimL family protein N-acetyltransferase